MNISVFSNIEYFISFSFFLHAVLCTSEKNSILNSEKCFLCLYIYINVMDRFMILREQLFHYFATVTLLKAGIFKGYRAHRAISFENALGCISHA